jgi:hypothetical protein
MEFAHLRPYIWRQGSLSAAIIGETGPQVADGPARAPLSSGHRDAKKTRRIGLFYLLEMFIGQPLNSIQQ